MCGGRREDKLIILFNSQVCHCRSSASEVPYPHELNISDEILGFKLVL
jgi:hypothetical protein